MAKNTFHILAAILLLNVPIINYFSNCRATTLSENVKVDKVVVLKKKTVSGFDF